MKVAAVTPTDAASDPLHPDHDRWVKDKTLKMEIDHARAVGLPLRVAEAENLRLLERAERIARDKKPAPAKKQKAAITPDMARRASRQERNQERGVYIKKAAPDVALLKLSPCGRCGTCRACLRERRVLLIVQKRKESAALGALASRMFITALHASSGVGKYKGLTKRDIDRAIAAEAEAACDASVRYLGEWRT